MKYPCSFQKPTLHLIPTPLTNAMTNSLATGLSLKHVTSLCSHSHLNAVSSPTFLKDSLYLIPCYPLQLLLPYLCSLQHTLLPKGSHPVPLLSSWTHSELIFIPPPHQKACQHHHWYPCCQTPESHSQFPVFIFFNLTVWDSYALIEINFLHLLSKTQ